MDADEYDREERASPALSPASRAAPSQAAGSSPPASKCARMTLCCFPNRFLGDDAPGASASLQQPIIWTPDAGLKGSKL